MIKIFVGDCREVMRSMEAESVHLVATSPPFYGLRNYQIAPSLWGGDPSCDHVWGDPQRSQHANSVPGPNGRSGKNGYGARNVEKETGPFCVKCGCWRGVLGMEPDFRSYVAHVVEVFREVRRVLRRDGAAFLNLGDSYATGAGAVGDHPGGGEQGSAWASRPAPGKTSWAGRGIGFRGAHAPDNSGNAAYSVPDGLGPMTQPNRMPQPGLKPKDLMLIPSRVAIALQDDGWWVRQDVIWHKPAPMVESVLDRCTKSHEYVFVLAKAEKYFWDAEAIAEPVTQSTVERMSQPNFEQQLGSFRVPGKTNGPIKAAVKRSGNKQRKPAGLRGIPGASETDPNGGVAGSVPWEGTTRNKRDVWTINTEPFGGEFCRACRSYFEGAALNALRVEVIEKEDGSKERRRWCRCGEHDRWLSHFATWPPALVEVMVKAGSSEKGCCAKCGAPWRREVESEEVPLRPNSNSIRGLEPGHYRALSGQPQRGAMMANKTTIGWSATCDCTQQTVDGKLARCVILDPFGGAGTTAMVADRLQRDAVIVEMNPEYAEMARQRLQLDAGPMFGDVRIEAAPVPEAAE